VRIRGREECEVSMGYQAFEGWRRQVVMALKGMDLTLDSLEDGYFKYPDTTRWEDVALYLLLPLLLHPDAEGVMSSYECASVARGLEALLEHKDEVEDFITNQADELMEPDDIDIEDDFWDTVKEMALLFRMVEPGQWVAFC